MFALGSRRLSDETLRKKYDTEHTRYLPFEGGQLRFEDQGNGPVLLLLHGLMANLRAWDAWLPELSKHCRVISMDIPGWGLSDTPSPKHYDPQIHIRAAIHLLDHLQVPAVTCVGHSYGGYVAWNLAVKHPKRIQRLVIVNGLSFRQPVRFDTKLMKIPLIRKSSRRMAPQPIIELVIHNMIVNKKALSRAQRQMYFDFLMRRGAKRIMSDAINWFIDYASADEALDPQLLEIKQPLLTLWGKRDTWVSYKHAGTHWARHYPDATHIAYTDAAHLTVDEKPAQSLNDLLEFLSQTDELLQYNETVANKTASLAAESL